MLMLGMLAGPLHLTLQARAVGLSGGCQLCSRFQLHCDGDHTSLLVFAM